MKNKTLIKKINEHYGVDCCFEQDNLVKVTSEVCFKEFPACDYYPCFSDYPYIDKWLEKLADSIEGYWEWESPACIVLGI